MSLENELKNRLKQDQQKYGLNVNFATKQFNPNSPTVASAPAPPAPMGNVYDLLGSTVYNFLDSATFGAVDLMADTQYDMEKFNEMNTMQKAGLALGQGLGFLVPMSFIGKGSSALIKSLDFTKEISKTNKARQAISTTGKVREAAEKAASLNKVGFENVATSKPVNKILEDALNTKSSKRFLSDYAISEKAIEQGAKLFRNDLTQGIKKSFNNKIDDNLAFRLADDMIKDLRSKGLHKNTLEGVIYEKFGSNLDQGIKKSLISYGARTAENLVNFTMYNVGAGIIQEIGNRGDYNYWSNLKETAPLTLAFSALTPAIDAIAKGGKAVSITQDFKRLMGNIVRPKNYSKLDKKSANYLLQLWGRHQASFSGLDLKSILGKSAYRTNNKQLSLYDLINGTVPDKMAQKLLTELNAIGRKELVRSFGSESAKDIFYSMPRMVLDGLIFSGINLVDSGNVIGRIGTEDFVANLIIGGIMAKKHRPLQADVGAPRFRYNNDFETQLNLFESFGLDTNNLRALVDNYDALRFNKTKARSYYQNDEIKQVIKIIDEAYSDDVQNRPEFYTDSTSEISSSRNSTLRTAYNEIYRTIKVMDVEGVIPNMKEIDWRKFKPNEIRELENKVSAIKIGEEAGNNVYLKNNVLKLQIEALKGSAKNVYDKYLESALKMSRILNIDPVERGDDGFMFFTAVSNNQRESGVLNEYNDTIKWLEKNSRGKSVISKDSRTIQTIDNIKNVEPFLKRIVADATKELSEEHYGFEKDMDWIDNDITNEVLNVRKFEDLEILSSFNLQRVDRIKELGSQYESILNALNNLGFVQGDKSYERLIDGYEFARNEERVDIETLNSDNYQKTIGLLDILNSVMSVGRQKLPETQNKNKIDYDEAFKLAEQIEQLFPTLVRAIDNPREREKILNFILRNKYQNVAISDSQFSIVNKIVRDRVFDLENFPNKDNAIGIIQQQLERELNLEGSELKANPDYQSALENLEGLYTEFEGLGDVIKFSQEKFISLDPNRKFYETKTDGYSVAIDETINYVEQFNELGLLTSKYFAESFNENMFKVKQLNEKISKEAEAILNLLQLELNNASQYGATGLDISKINEGFDKLLKLNLSKESEDVLTAMQKEFENFNNIAENQRIEALDVAEQLSKISNKNKSWLGKTPIEMLKQLSLREIQQRNDIAEAASTLIFYGSAGSTREKAIKAEKVLREEIAKSLTDSSPNTNLSDLLEKYNKTGNYVDFKNYLKNLQLTLNRTYTDKDMSDQDEGFRRVYDDLLETLQDGHTNANLDKIAKDYEVLIDPESKGFDQKLMTEITYNINDLRLNKTAKAKKNLFENFDKIIDSVSKSKKLINRKNFFIEELAPVLNALMSSSSTPVLTYKDGGFIYKSKTKIYTPTDDFIDNMEKFGIGLVELESSAISKDRYTHVNKVQDENNNDLDNILSSRDISVAPFVDSDTQKAIGNRLPIESMTQKFEGGRYVRIGISNYKNLLFNSDNKSRLALHEIFTKWYKNKFEKVDEKSKQNLESLFKEIVELDNPSSLNYAEIQSMIRSLYFDKMNTSLFNEVLSFRDGKPNERYQQRLGYMKYVHVIEGANTSQINKNLLEYLQKTYKKENIMEDFVNGLENINNRGDLSGKIGVAVIDDESPLGDFFNSRKRILNVIDDIIDQISKAENTTYKEDMIKNWTSLKKQLEDGKDFPSIGNDKKIVSMFNGITFIGDDLGAVGMGLRGRDISTITQGLKPVIRHNSFDYKNPGAQDSSTLVGKTFFVRDPEIAKAMKTYNKKNKNQYIDMITFKSAAKSFSGNYIYSNDKNNHFSSGNVEKGFERLLTDELKTNEFYIDIEDIGINYPTKDVHDATLTASLYSSVNSSEALNRWLGYRDGKGDIGKFIDDVTSPLHAIGTNKLNSLAQSLFKSMNDKGFNLNDPSISTVNKLINLGIDANSPLVRYDIYRMIKTNLIDKLKSPKTQYGTTSPLIPDFRTGKNKIKYLDIPLYENSKQTKYGGLTASYQMMTRVADLENLSFVATNSKTGRDIVISSDKNYSVLDDLKNYSDDWKFDLYEQLGKVDNLTYKQVFDLLDYVKNTDNLTENVEMPNGIKLKFDKNTIKTIKDSNLEIGVSALRIPKQSSSDFVINRVQGYFEENRGNLVAVNMFELATKHQGDFDVDKLFYYFNTPSDVLKDLGNNAGRVLDVKPIEAPKYYNIDFFQQGSDLNMNQLKNTPAGVSIKDGVAEHNRNIYKAQELLGRSVRLLSTLKNLSLTEFEFKGAKLTSDEVLDQLNASLISASVDVHKGIADFIVNKNNSVDDIYKWLLFGDGADGKRFPKKPDTSLFKDKDGDPIQLNSVEKNAIIEALNTVGRLQRSFSGIFDENGSHTPELQEIKSIYQDVKSFYRNPSKYLFKKLVTKEFYKSKREKRDAEYGLIIDSFFPGSTTKINEYKQILENIRNNRFGDLPIDILNTLGDGADKSQFKILGNIINEDTRQAFEKSPAGVHVYELAKRDFGDVLSNNRKVEEFGTSIDRMIDNMSFLRAIKGVQGTREGEIENLVLNSYDIATTKDENLSGLKANFADVNQRSLLYNALEVKIENSNRQIERLKKDKYADQEYLNELKFKHLLMQSTRDLIASKLDEFVLNNDAYKSKSYKKDATIENTIDKPLYVYRVENNKSPNKFYQLNEYRILNKGDKVIAWDNNFITTRQAFITKPFTDDYKEGIAWFMATDRHAEILNTPYKDEYINLLKDIERVRHGYKKKAFDTSEEARSRIAYKDVLYNESGIELKNIIGGIFERNLNEKEYPINTKQYKEKVDLIVNALLSPKAVFGSAVKGQNYEKLPMFVQDNKFAKGVLDYLLESNDYRAESAKNVINLQKDYLQTIKYNKKLTAETVQKLRYNQDSKAFFSDSYNYSKVIGTKLARDLISSNFPIPSALSSRLENLYPKMYKTTVRARESTDGNLAEVVKAGIINQHKNASNQEISKTHFAYRMDLDKNGKRNLDGIRCPK